VESVYSAVRTDSSYKADYISFLKSHYMIRHFKVIQIPDNQLLEWHTLYTVMLQNLFVMHIWMGFALL